MLARRLLGALLTTRSFLLLEDDHDVDWEVDGDEPTGPQARGLRSSTRSEAHGHGGVHPHRMALRSRIGERRPGAGVPREQVCLCPLPPRAERPGACGPQSLSGSQRGSRITTGSVRVAIDR
jgi:hypothetical protein